MPSLPFPVLVQAEEIKMSNFVCIQCGHKWKSRRGIPLRCASNKCASKYWQNPRPDPLWFLVRDVPVTDECVEWKHTIATNNDGYGQVCYMGKVVGVHCVSFTIHKGPIPSGLHVCHTCDNPPCFNPRHLFIGSRVDNMQDCIFKGRFPSRKGENSPRALLTEAQVLAIRGIYRPKTRGLGYRSLAAKYGVADSTMRSIIIGKTWQHI